MALGGLTSIFSGAGSDLVNLNTQQNLDFCARQQLAAGLALYICPGHPGAAS